MKDQNFSKTIRYVGVDDLDLDLFESQYELPEGMAYNSYVILDEKTTVMDAVDFSKCSEWLANLEKELAGKTPEYLVCLHAEPDHSGSIVEFLKKYPSAKCLCSAKAAQFLPQFYDFDFASRLQVVKDGETLTLGSHTLQFASAPMVHWPEVMVAYEQSEKVAFSADAFGKFGAIVHETDDWACEARRYYFNICGKYGNQVQSLLKKMSAWDVKVICPLHGPVLNENLKYYVDLYDTWSAYRAETSGVFIAYASVYGGTKKAAEKLAEILEAKGLKVAISDLNRCDMAEAIEDAFRYDRMVLAASSYDAGVMPAMETFLCHLKAKNYQKRRVAIMENGTWAPTAAKTMLSMIETMKEIEKVGETVSIKSVLRDDAPLAALAEALQ